MVIENNFLDELRKIIDDRPRGYQSKIANAVGVKVSTFSNMVCGRRGMDEDTRRKVAAFVGINYEDVAASSFSGTMSNSIATFGNHSVTATNGSSVNIRSASSSVDDLTSTEKDAIRILRKLGPQAFEAILLFDEVGNETILNRCVDRLRKARVIFG